MPEDQTLTIPSPYPDNTLAFDNRTEDHFADVQVLLSDATDAPPSLLLHRTLLSRASSTFAALFHDKTVDSVHYDAATQRVVGLHTDVNGRDVLVRWLRFCYGSSMHVETRTAVAALAALLWLRLRCCECNLQQRLEDFIVHSAKQSVQAGAALLVECVASPLCRGSTNDENSSSVDRALAKCVLTRANLEANRDAVVNCLVKLPPEFLDVAEYGEPHTECSEFSVRADYLKHNKGKLSVEEQRRITSRLTWSELSASELGKLRGVLDPGVLFVMQQIRLKELEKSARELGRVRVVEKEVEEERKNVVAAEQEKKATEERCKLCALSCFSSLLMTTIVPFPSLKTSGETVLSNWITKLASLGCAPASFAAKNKKLFFEDSLGTNCEIDVTREQLKALIPYLQTNLMQVRNLCLCGLLFHSLSLVSRCHIVWITGKGLGDKDICSIGTVLETNTTITELDLKSKF